MIEFFGGGLVLSELTQSWVQCLIRDDGLENGRQVGHSASAVFEWNGCFGIRVNLSREPLA